MSRRSPLVGRVAVISRSRQCSSCSWVRRSARRRLEASPACLAAVSSAFCHSRATEAFSNRVARRQTKAEAPSPAVANAVDKASIRPHGGSLPIITLMNDSSANGAAWARPSSLPRGFQRRRDGGVNRRRLDQHRGDVRRRVAAKALEAGEGGGLLAHQSQL